MGNGFDGGKLERAPIETSMAHRELRCQKQVPEANDSAICPSWNDLHGASRGIE